MIDMAPQLNQESPYSLKNLKWLMDFSSVKKYLGSRAMMEITDALEKGNEELLKSHYARLLKIYLQEKDIEIKRALREDLTLATFEIETKKTGENIKNENVKFKNNMETIDSNFADSILNNL